MEVRRSFLAGVVASQLALVVAPAKADSSSTAAFPASPAPSQGETNPSSRAAFPSSAGSSQSAAPVRRVSPSAPAPAPQQFGTPSYAGAPNGSSQGYSYGYGNPAQPYGPVGYGQSSYYGPGYSSPGEKKEEPEKEAPRYVSLTVSAIRLILPVFEATLEARPADHVGLAVFGGLGEASPKILGQALVDSSDRFSVREIGAQFLAYPLARFDGLVLGGEILYSKISGTVTADSLDVSGSALAVGPLVGGKWIHSSGFTLFAHAGVQRVWLKADSTAYGQTVSQSDAIWFPLINVNVGWSF